MIDRSRYGDNELDIERALKDMRKESAASKLQSSIRSKKARNDLTSQIMDGSLNDLDEIFQDTAASKLQTAIRRQKAQSNLITAKKVRQQKIQKGKEIFEKMKQKRYKDYLQEDAATNFNTLSKKAITKQQKQLQTIQMVTLIEERDQRGPVHRCDLVLFKTF